MVPDVPFIVVAALLLLWGSGKSDSNVTYFAAIFGCAYVVVEALAQASSGGVIMFPQDAIPQTDLFTPYFTDDEKSLSMFLLMMFCFAFGVLGTTVFAFSPFVGEILYATVVTALFRDMAIIGDARVIVWSCVLLSGALSEHVFRLNLAALTFALLCWEKKLNFPQRGAFETLSFMNAVVILTIHDLLVRFLLEPIKALVEAGFLGMTAYVMVDSAIELGALPANHKLNSARLGQLLNVKWSNCIETSVLISPFSPAFPRRLAQASPVLASLFCAGYFYRTILTHKSTLDWIKWQQVSGVGIGTALGLHLWTRYGRIDAFDPMSPVAVCWVMASLLFYTSSLLNASAGSTPKRNVWHQTYWNGQAKSLFGGKGNKPTDGKSRKASPYPTLLLGSFSATYPEIYDIALKLEDDHFALESNLAKLRTINEKEMLSEYAKQSFRCTQLVNTLVKHCEDLAKRVEARSVIVLTESQILAQARESTSAQKSKHRYQTLQQDLIAIRSYSDQLRRELNKRDDETLLVLEKASEVFSLNPSPAVDERSLKLEADELDSMCEAVRKRIKHRKKDDDPPGTQVSSTAAPAPPMTLSPSVTAGAEIVRLPIIPPNQSMFPSERDTSDANRSSPSSTKKSKGLFRFPFSKKKSTSAASPEQLQPPTSPVVTDERQSVTGSSAGKSSSKKWGSFMRRKPATPPQTPAQQAPAI